MLAKRCYQSYMFIILLKILPSLQNLSSWKALLVYKLIILSTNQLQLKNECYQIYCKELCSEFVQRKLDKIRQLNNKIYGESGVHYKRH